MLDIRFVRENPEAVKENIRKKFQNAKLPLVDEVIALDSERREAINEGEALKAERNKKSAEIPKLKKEDLDTSELLAELKQLSETISSNDEKIDSLQREQEEFLQGLPNLPAEDVVAGGKEANQVVHTFGEQRDFDFEPKHHVDLLTSLGMIDYERGAKLSGSGYWL